MTPLRWPKTARAGWLVTADLDSGSVYQPPTMTRSLDTGALIQIDPVSGTQAYRASGAPFENPSGLVVNAAGTTAYVSDTGTNGDPKILAVDLSSGSVVTVATGGYLAAPAGITLAPDGQLLVADAYAGGTGRVIRIDPATGEQTIVSAGGLVSTNAHFTSLVSGSVFVSTFSIKSSACQVILP